MSSRSTLTVPPYKTNKMSRTAFYYIIRIIHLIVSLFDGAQLSESRSLKSIRNFCLKFPFVKNICPFSTLFTHWAGGRWENWKLHPN